MAREEGRAGVALALGWMAHLGRQERALRREGGPRLRCADRPGERGLLGRRFGGEPRGGQAAHRLELAGAIPGADVAGAVARDELGGALGALAGDIAGRSVGGSAVVSVSVEADTRDLGAAKVRPKVGMGCGLKLPGL